MNKEILAKGIKLSLYTIGLMFIAPVVIYEAFKNQEHSFYWPVLIVGGILAIAAISLGFYSIKVIMDALFWNNKKSNRSK